MATLTLIRPEGGIVVPASFTTFSFDADTDELLCANLAKLISHSDGIAR
jgi:hypothetical protein